MGNDIDYEKVVKFIIGQHNMFLKEEDKILMTITEKEIRIEFRTINSIIVEKSININNQNWKRLCSYIFDTLINKIKKLELVENNCQKHNCNGK